MNAPLYVPLCAECLESLEGYATGVTLCDECHDGVTCRGCDDARDMSTRTGLAYVCGAHA